MLLIESTTKERLKATVTAGLDPTGSPPEWSVTPGDREDPGTWHAGSWSGSWSARTSRVVALSPSLGAGQTLDVAPGEWNVWGRWDDGTDRPVKWLGSISVR